MNHLRKQTRIARAFLVFGMLAVPASRAAAAENYRQDFVQAGALRVHYLHAGSGPKAIVLLHGWPESSHEWRLVIPMLAKRYSVYAPDLRGIGSTQMTDSGYDKANLAQDLHNFIGAVKLRRPIVVGHDIGGMVAYAYARQFPNESAGVAIVDVPLPGVEPMWTNVLKDPHAWHFAFHDQNPLAEQLVSGREAVYFRYFVNQQAKNGQAISDADIAEFAKAYSPVGRLRAGFGFYRAFEQDAKFNKDHIGKLETPLLILGGDHNMGLMEGLLEQGLRSLGAQNISKAVVPDSGHWVAEENAAGTAKAIEDFVSRLK